MSLFAAMEASEGNVDAIRTLIDIEMRLGKMPNCQSHLSHVELIDRWSRTLRGVSSGDITRLTRALCDEMERTAATVDRTS